MSLKGPRVKIVEVVKVIRVVHLAGMGTEESPAVEIEEFYGMDGKLIGSEWGKLTPKETDRELL